MADPGIEMLRATFERVADNLLLTVQELRNGAKIGERHADLLHRATEAVLAVKREISESSSTHESVLREWVHTLKSVNDRLAVISKDVDDVERAAREATGAHKLVAAQEGHAGLLAAWGQMPLRSQLIIAAVLLAAILGGGAGHWLLSLIGK